MLFAGARWDPIRSRGCLASYLDTGGVVQRSAAQAPCDNFALKEVRCDNETASCAFFAAFFVGGAPTLGFATLGSDNVLLEAKLVVNPVADPGRKP